MSASNKFDDDERLDRVLFRVVMIGLLACAVLGVVHCAFAGNCRPTDDKAALAPIGYQTAQSAAIAALAPFLQSHPKLEAGGMVVRYQHRYYNSVANSGTENSVCINVDIPQGGVVAAIWHTHPGAEHASLLFSAVDIQTAILFGVPSYIGVTDQGVIIRWMPGDEVFEAVTGETVSYGTAVWPAKDRT